MISINRWWFKEYFLLMTIILLILLIADIFITAIYFRQPTHSNNSLSSDLLMELRKK